MLTRSCRARAFAVAVAACASAFARPVLAAEHGGGGGSRAAPVDNQLHPHAVILHTRNPLAVHAGPGKPNVGTVYLPPSLSGKDKKAKSGQTEQKVMGATPAH